MIVTMVLAKSRQKLHQRPADEMDLKSLTAACKDGANFCEDLAGKFPIGSYLKVKGSTKNSVSFLVLV